MAPSSHFATMVSIYNPLGRAPEPVQPVVDMSFSNTMLRRTSVFSAQFFCIFLLLLSGACEITPAYVENSDVDDAFARGNYKTVCVGLSMDNEAVRRYATTRLLAVDDPIARECVCEHITRNGHWDPAVAEGLKGSDRDDMVGCLAELLDQPDVRDREELVVALSRTAAPVARERLAKVAAEPGDPSTRARAIRTLTGTGDPEKLSLLIDLLRSGDAPVLRAAAAAALVGQKEPRATAALEAAFHDDADGSVRIAALLTLRRLHAENARELTCKAMLEDPDPQVRKEAISALRGTKSKKSIACLRDRALTEESEPQVREELLEVIKSSPRQEAADILCDAIPFWLRHYAKEDLPENLPGTNIVVAQNDRDWKNSYECFAKAYAKRSGYSCYGKQHIAYWFKEVGGKAFIPRCPKPGEAGSGKGPSGPTEIVF